jgi:hypothetical protein
LVEKSFILLLYIASHPPHHPKFSFARSLIHHPCTIPFPPILPFMPFPPYSTLPIPLIRSQLSCRLSVVGPVCCSHPSKGYQKIKQKKGKIKAISSHTVSSPAHISSFSPQFKKQPPPQPPSNTPPLAHQAPAE